MSRRASGIPQTPVHNDDALERSLRRQQSSARGHSSISDVARRVQDSPLHKEPGRHSRQASGSFAQSSMGTQTTQVAVGDFQEWMKMVRMKRVKANNAFAIQLIDAFHSMVQGEILSSGGQNVTFQEATHTLGGCLTVYKNRIARVKDDTSKLLVGVSDKKATEADRDDPDAASDDSEDETADSDESNEVSKKGKKKRRSKAVADADAFLTPVNKREIDVSELATSIDPLLRKMSADFDKRGAVALLQYSLKIDQSGRLLLDTEAQEISEPQVSQTQATPSNTVSTTALATIAEEDEEAGDEHGGSNDASEHSVDSAQVLNQQAPKQELTEPSDGIGSDEDASAGNRIPEEESVVDNADDLDLAHFNVAYFANVDLNHREALPLVDSIARAVANPDDGAEQLVRDMQAWASVDPANASTYSQEGAHDAADEPDDEEFLDNAAFDNELALEGLGVGFNNAGGMEFDDPAEDVPLDGGDHSSNLSINSIVSTRMPASGNWMDIEYLQRLDSQKTNWAGPSFWKVRRLHARENEQKQGAESGEGAEKAKPTRRNASDVPTVIDFSQDDPVDLNDLFAPGAKSTLLNNKQYDLNNKHLLPVDMHVTTRQLVALQLRPKTGLAPAFQRGAWRSSLESTRDVSSMDHSYAHHTLEPGMESIDGGGNVANDDDYFYGGWDDLGAEDAFRPSTASAMFTQSTQTGYGVQGNQLNFSRVAKKVDVRRLKDNVWRAIQREDAGAPPSGEEPQQNSDPAHDAPEHSHKSATLLKVIHDTQPLYTDQQRSDLSPAMYFISLLHLSNEKGLSLENTESLTDIRIIPQTS